MLAPLMFSVFRCFQKNKKEHVYIAGVTYLDQHSLKAKSYNKISLGHASRTLENFQEACCYFQKGVSWGRLWVGQK